MRHSTAARTGVVTALAASVIALGVAPASAAPAAPPAPQTGVAGTATGSWSTPWGASGPINATLGSPTATVGADGRVVLGADVAVTAVGSGAPTTTQRVSLPTTVTSAAAPGTRTGLAAADIPVPAGCTVLHLVLGPLDLNLLGLAIVLQQVTLDVVAVPGPGNLLGNLLCAIVNLIPAPPTA